MTTRYVEIDSPVGRLRVITDGDRAVRRILFQRDVRRIRPDKDWVEGGKLAKRTARQLQDYFKGKRVDFQIPVDPGGTPFQREVWDELQRVEHGEVISYGELARRVGRPKASRAVGAANGANPIPIIIPCHRIVGSTGKLTGFTGGLSIKKKLIDLEDPQPHLGLD